MQAVERDHFNTVFWKGQRLADLDCHGSESLAVLSNNIVVDANAVGKDVAVADDLKHTTRRIDVLDCRAKGVDAG